MNGYVTPAVAHIGHGRVSQIFLDQERRPRAGWRCAGYLIAWVLLIGLLSGTLGGKNPSPLEDAAYAAAVVPAVLGLTYLFRRFADRRAWQGLGLSPSRRSLPLLAAGFGSGLAGIAVVMLAEWTMGWIRITGTDITTRGLPEATILLASGLAYYAATAVTEELAFRGYLFRNTASSLPVWGSVILVGIVFAGLHLVTNSMATPWFVLIVPFSGLALQAFEVQTRLITGTLWLAIGWHAGWDWSESQVVDLSSGGDQQNFLLHVHQNGPLLFVGQPGFIEGGLVVGFVTVLCLAVALLSGHRVRKHWAARIPDDEHPETAAARLASYAPARVRSHPCSY